MVRRQSEIPRRHVRQREYHVGSPAHGLADTAHTRHTYPHCQAKKRYRKKPTYGARLCADDIMNRQKLKDYQDSYAQAMGRYGLQRGIDGSEAKHISTRQYYREVKRQTEELKAE